MALPFPDLAFPETAGPVARSLMRLFHACHWRMWSEVKDLTAGQMNWRPAPGADSIRMILDHVTAAEKGLIDIILLQQPLESVLPDKGSQTGTHLHRWGREDCRSDGEYAADAYVADLLREYERAMTLIGSLSDEQLQNGQCLLWASIPVEEGIIHMAEHIAHHKGQIVFMTLMEGFPGSEEPK